MRAQARSPGVALVIGNSKYKWEASLPNVRRDAPDVARAFQALGLKTELLQDVGRDAMRAAVDKFAASCRGAEFAAFYYAGHGAAWEKDTYLVGEDTDLANPATVQSLLPVSAISAAMKDAAHRLLVFDNCRNNPADGWRQRAAVELSRVAATELAAGALDAPNTLVLFSTAPGRVAVDGPPGENSPFAATFLRKLAGPTIDLQALAADLRRDLLIATEGRQVLWDQSTYEQPFVLNGPRTRGAANPRPAVDASRIVELPRIYAFARERKLLLPPGLVAMRSPGSVPDNPRIGSYETTTRMSLGHNPDNLYWSIEALLVIVVSVSADGTAEIIASGRDWRSTTLDGAGGNIWRYTTGTFSGPSLQFRFGRASTTDSPRTFKWKDANSGTHTVRASGILEYSTPFRRLDG